MAMYFVPVDPVLNVSFANSCRLEQMDPSTHSTDFNIQNEIMLDALMESINAGTGSPPQRTPLGALPSPTTFQVPLPSTISSCGNIPTVKSLRQQGYEILATTESPCALALVYRRRCTNSIAPHFIPSGEHFLTDPGQKKFAVVPLDQSATALAGALTARIVLVQEGTLSEKTVKLGQDALFKLHQVGNETKHAEIYFEISGPSVSAELVVPKSIFISSRNVIDNKKRAIKKDIEMIRSSKFEECLTRLLDEYEKMDHNNPQEIIISFSRQKRERSSKTRNDVDETDEHDVTKSKRQRTNAMAALDGTVLMGEKNHKDDMVSSVDLFWQ
jgi:hypothetical protein